MRVFQRFSRLQNRADRREISITLGARPGRAHGACVAWRRTRHDLDRLRSPRRAGICGEGSIVATVHSRFAWRFDSAASNSRRSLRSTRRGSAIAIRARDARRLWPGRRIGKCHRTEKRAREDGNNSARDLRCGWNASSAPRARYCATVQARRLRQLCLAALDRQLRRTPHQARLRLRRQRVRG